MTRKDIIEAWARIRKIDHTIPDDVLDFMKDSAIEKIEHKANSPKNPKPMKPRPGDYFECEAEGSSMSKFHGMTWREVYLRDLRKWEELN